MKKNSKSPLQFNNKVFGNFLLWSIIISIVVLVVIYMDPSSGKKEITYSELQEMLFEFDNSYNDKNICESLDEYVWLDQMPKKGCYKVNSNVIEIRNKDDGYTEIDITEVKTNLEGEEAVKITYVTHADRNQLRENVLDKFPNLKYQYIQPTQSFWSYFMNFAPWLLIIVFWFVIMKRMQGGGQSGGIFSFAKSKARIISSKNTKVLFKDVAGCEEAKTELEEIVQFLKKPNKYKKLGAKIPRGALLLGPPGTGKTLLAKAVSGEAKVPFFTISGAEFVEMFVGVGASRVRDLFDQAKKNSPSIIFIDEIDAVGRHRGAGLGGGHDEREQTLNQILVEMDGFDTNTNVILLAATNRPDVLDKALLRPGRFDRQVVVDTPDVYGREAILKIHTKKIKLSKDVVLKTIAKSTPGLSGADLENLANESALLAARNNQSTVSMRNFEDAKDKIMMGNERKSMILSDNDKRIIAFHEAGHALVAYFTKGADPVHKITIIPRGMALGVTAQIPEADRYNYPKSYLLGKIDILMGGRCAEKLIFNDTSTGAGNDIEVATNIARKMVCEWGMSDKVGPLRFGKKDEQVFLGKEIAQQKDYSEEKSTIIDNEVSRIILTAEKNADNLLKKYKNELDLIADALISNETISGEQMETIIKTKSKLPVNSDSKIQKKRTRRASKEIS